MRIIQGVILAIAAVSYSAYGSSAVQAAELYSDLNIKGTGTGSYQSTTNYPGETGYSTSGAASFFGDGSFYNFFSPDSFFDVQIAGLKSGLSVYGDPFNGGADYNFTGNTLKGYVLNNNLAANYSFESFDYDFTNLVYTVSRSPGGLKTYNITSGQGVITYSQDIYDDEYNDDGSVTRFFVDATATINLTNVSGTYSVLSPIPIPAAAPMFGAAVLALGLVGYSVRRKKAAAAA